MRFFDAHNHLQDDRFGGRQTDLLRDAAAAGVVRMVVNGSVESDWPKVADLARRSPSVIPSFGLHPWYLREMTRSWKDRLRAALDSFPAAGIGEIGLDGWLPSQPAAVRARYAPDLMENPAPTLSEQEEPFLWQFDLAVERALPVSVHCLGAFGRLRDLLAGRRRPDRGFLLHSYGGPVEMVPEFARLGARFSFAGYFGHPRKEARREAFRRAPPDRLLVETDAPDQLPPAEWIWNAAPPDAAGRAIHSPANLPAIYELLARVRSESTAELAGRVEENFAGFFGALGS